jgi:septum formation protein
MLLDRLQLPYQVVSPQVEEGVVAGESPPERALRLARLKAVDVASQHPRAIVIGSDQVASLERSGEHLLLRKPGNRETCRGQLAAMSGRTARFDTAVAVRLGQQELTHLEPTLVHLRELGAQEIEHYMDREPAFDCAGGFKCEGLGVTLFRAMETRDPTALVGLPLVWLCEALRQLGVKV